MEKYINKVQEVEIFDYNYLGQGVGKIDDMIIFVNYAQKDKVEKVIVCEVKKNFLIGEVEDFQKEVLCKNYYKCGGCELMHLEYEQEIIVKKNAIKSTLAKQGVIVDDVEVEVNPSKDKGYRNKSRYFLNNTQNKISSALYKKSSNLLQPIDYCHLQTENANEIREKIVERISNENKSLSKQMDLIEVKESENDNSFMIIIVVKKLTQEIKTFIETLASIDSKINSIIVKDKKSKMVLGEEFIFEKINNITYYVSDESFFQVNTKQAENMVNYIKQEVQYTDKKILDAYCGSGFFSLQLADKCNQIVGIELNRDAIKLANRNKRLNAIANAKYICADIEKEILKYEENNSFFDIIIIDPPRKGLQKQFIKVLVDKKPEEIIYVSCNYATLARDIKHLSEHYYIDKIKGFDMFTYTHHVEVICILKRK